MIDDYEILFDQYGKKYLKLCKEEKHQAALPIVKKLLNLTLRHYGKNHIESSRLISTLGFSYELLHKYKNAESLYLSTLKIRENLLKKDHPDVLRAIKDLHYLYKKTGNHDEADYFFEKYFNRKSDDQLLKETSKTYSKEGRYEAGEKLVVKNIAKYGLNDLRFELLCELYIDQNEYEKCEAFCLKSIKKDAKNNHFYEQLSYVYSVQEDLKKQEDILTKALSIGIETFYIYFDFGRLYRKQDKTKKAYSFLSKAKVIIPDKSPSAYCTLGQEYLEINRFDEAINLLEEGRGKYENNLDIQKQLVIAYLFNGDFNNAEISINKLISSQDLNNQILSYNMAEFLLECGSIAVNSCPQSLSILEEAYFDLPEIDTSKWDYGYAKRTLGPKWLVPFFSLDNYLKRKPYFQKILNAFGFPVVSLVLAIFFFGISNLSFGIEIKFFKIYGYLFIIVWSVLISLSVASFITALATGGINMAETYTNFQKFKRIGSYLLSSGLLYWIGIKIQFSTEAVYQLSGKTIQWVAYIYPIVLLTLSFISWKIVKNESFIQSQNDIDRSEIVPAPNNNEIKEKMTFANDPEIRQAIMVEKFIRYGMLSFLMIFFGGFTLIKIIGYNHYMFKAGLPLAVSIIEGIQGFCLPLTVYFSLKLFGVWRITNKKSFIFKELFICFSYSIFFSLLSTFIFILLNKEQSTFQAIFLLLFVSLLSTMFGGILIGNLTIKLKNHIRSAIFFTFCFFSIQLLTFLFIFLLSVFLESILNSGLQYSIIKELFIFQILFGELSIVLALLASRGFKNLKLKLEQHEREKRILVQFSDSKLKPAYELVEKMLKGIDRKSTVKEYYVALDAALQIYFPGDCLFLPPLLSSITLSRVDNFLLTFNAEIKQELFDLILSCLALQKFDNMEDGKSFTREDLSKYSYKDKIFENRDKLAEKIRQSEITFTDTLIFQTIYQNGEYLLREGRVVEAIELSSLCIQNAISKETQIEFLLSAYKFSLISGRQDVSSKILNDFRNKEITNKKKYSIGDHYTNFIIKLLSLQFPLDSLVTFSMRFSEGILCALEASNLLKNIKKLQADIEKKDDALERLSNVRNKLDQAWQGISNKFEYITFGQLSKTEFEYSLRCLQCNEDVEYNKIDYFVRAIAYWYFYVLVGPASKIILSRRSYSIDLRIKSIEFINSKKPNNPLQIERIGRCLIEWIEHEKWDLIFMRSFSLEDVDTYDWESNTSRLSAYPMDANSCIATHLIDLSRLLYATGKRKAAFSVLKFTSNLNRTIISPAINRDLSILYGEINLSLGKSDEALSDLRKALELSSHVAKDLHSEGQIIDFNTENINLYNLLIEEYFKRSDFETCLTLIERGRSESLATIMQSKTNIFVDMLDEKDEDWVKLETLRAKIFEIQSRCGVVKKQTKRDMLFLQEKIQKEDEKAENLIKHSEKCLNKLKQELEILEREYRLVIENLLEKKSPDIDYLQSPLAFEKLCENLMDDEAFLIIHETENHLFCFWSTNKKIFGYQVSDKAKVLANNLAEMLRSPKTPYKKIDQLLIELSELFLSSLKKISNKRTETELRIYYVPTGIWSELPLTLLKEHCVELENEEWTIATLPSATIYNYLTPVGHLPKISVIGIGNPFLGSSEYDLPYAAHEVEVLKNQFPESQVLIGQNATIEAFFNGLKKQPNIVHFACHGEFRPDQPMLSSLRLAPSENNDGVLDGYKFRYHGLGENVDLCVLSACWSGRASVAGFNEQIGLSRTLLGAGASSIITSLWAIDDKSTALFFEKFYESIKFFSPAQSLEIAKDYLKNDPRYSHPYYWAPFLWTGSL